MKKLALVGLMLLVMVGCTRVPPTYRLDTFTGESWHQLGVELRITSWVKSDFGKTRFDPQKHPAWAAGAEYINYNKNYPARLFIMKELGEDEIYISFTFSSPKKYNLKSISFLPSETTLSQELSEVKSDGQVLTTAVSIYTGKFNGNSIRIFKNPYRYEECLQGRIPYDRFRKILESDGVKFRATGENGDIDFFIEEWNIEEVRKFGTE